MTLKILLILTTQCYSVEGLYCLKRQIFLTRMQIPSGLLSVFIIKRKIFATEFSRKISKCDSVSRQAKTLWSGQDGWGSLSIHR